MANPHEIVDRATWLDARKKLLADERELTRTRERLAQKRRALPWVRIDKPYRFQSTEGSIGLADLFEGRSQLAMYHFMFSPEWDIGCKSCSFWADGFNGIVSHLKARDVSFCAVSRAPVAKLQAHARRMGWSFRWVSSYEDDFNYDFGVSFTPEQLKNGSASYNFGVSPADGDEMPGISVFYRDPSGEVFHTYSCYARGIDMMNPTYQYLDLVPKGRDEAGLPHTMAWVQLHDAY
jgi:predicted dithiol-disulfide oxidoreductase (DUF899 family)